MTDYYVDISNTGSIDGTSWATAFPNVDDLPGTLAAGSRVLIAHNHDETISAQWSVAGGTVAAPIVVCSATQDSSPPAYQAGATLRGVTSSRNIKPADSGYVAFWGMTLRADAGSGDDMYLGRGTDAMTWYFDCELHVRDRCYIIAGTDAVCVLTDTNINLNSSTGDCRTSGSRNRMTMRGGTITDGQLSYALEHTYGGTMSFKGVDLSSYTEAVNTHHANKNKQVLVSGCAVGPGWDGSNVPSNYGTDAHGEIILTEYSEDGTISGPVEGLYEKLDFSGRTRMDIARWRTGGAKSALSGAEYCHAIVSRNNYATATDGHHSTELVGRVRGGTAVTLTVYVSSGGTLYDDELWLEIFGPSTSTTAQQHFAQTRLANPLATRAALTSDTASEWIGSGVSTAQSISYSWTPAIGGIVRVTPVFGKGGDSVCYLDPRLDIV